MPLTCYQLLILCLLGASYAQHADSVQYTYNGITCLKCEPGKYVKKHCVTTYTHSDCAACPNGTFQNVFNRAESCAVCKTRCLANNAVPYQQCRATGDMLCHCEDGYWGNAENENEIKLCTKHQICKDGEVISKNGTRATDVECEPCESGTYFVANGGGWQWSHCEHCSACLSGMVLVSPCNQTADTVCVPQGSQGLSGGHIAVIVIASVIIPVIVLIIVIIYCKRRRQSQERDVTGDRDEMQRFVDNGQVQRNEDGEDENPTADDDHPKSVVSHSSGPADSEPNLQASGCIPGDGNATGTSTANTASDEAPLATAEEFGEVTILTEKCRREIFKLLRERLSDWIIFFSSLPDEDWKDNVGAICEQTEIEIKRTGIFTVKCMIDAVLVKWTEQCPQHVTINAISDALISAGRPDVQQLAKQIYSE